MRIAKEKTCNVNSLLGVHTKLITRALVSVSLFEKRLSFDLNEASMGKTTVFFEGELDAYLGLYHFNKLGSPARFIITLFAV